MRTQLLIVGACIAICLGLAAGTATASTGASAPNWATSCSLSTGWNGHEELRVNVTIIDTGPTSEPLNGYTVYFWDNPHSGSNIVGTWINHNPNKLASEGISLGTTIDPKVSFKWSFHKNQALWLPPRPRLGVPMFCAVLVQS